MRTVVKLLVDVPDIGREVSVAVAKQLSMDKVEVEFTNAIMWTDGPQGVNEGHRTPESCPKGMQ